MALTSSPSLQPCLAKGTTTTGMADAEEARWGKREVEIKEEVKDMKPENAEVLLDLLEEVRRQREEEEANRTYTWMKDCDVNLWAFKDKHPGMMKGLQEELDPEVWEDVAVKLGLTNQQIEKCRKSEMYSRGYGSHSFAREMFNTLAVSPRHRDLTLKTVLEALKELKRHDILRRLQGFDCLKMMEKFNDAKTFTQTIQRPREVLVASANTGTTTEAIREVNGVVPKPPQQPQSFVAKVLVIHASDAKEEALKFVAYLKSPVSDRSVRVVLLQESQNTNVQAWLEIDPYNSIHKWFLSVDVVVPVLSPQLLRQIQNLDTDDTDARDARRDLEKNCNRYVYRMMLDQFVEIGCKNFSCRAVCPGRYLSEVNTNPLVQSSPLFRMNWNLSSQSQLEECASAVFMTAKAVRKMRRRRR